jgi:serine transporter
MSKFEKKFNKVDVQWAVNLFGTAVGAGILFLPLRVGGGGGGFLALLLMLIIIFPMMYLGHRYLAYFVVNAKTKDGLLESVNEGFGKKVGVVLSVLFFFAIYPICLIYGVGITNTVTSFLVNQLHFQNVYRPAVAVVMISFFMFSMLLNKELVLKILSFLTYPLIVLLFICSLYLIPNWKADSVLFQVPQAGGVLKSLWISLPILVFAFNYSPAVSLFAQDNRLKYGADAENKVAKTMLLTTTILSTFIFIFIISCLLALSPSDLVLAKNANIPTLSYFANISGDNVFLKYVAPIIAILAISSSFFGHYFGAKEGLVVLLENKIKNKKLVVGIVNLFMYITMIIVALINPNILGFIESLGAPILVMILFIFPIIAMYKVDFMRKYQAYKLTNLFLLAMGVITLIAVGILFFQ